MYIIHEYVDTPHKYVFNEGPGLQSPHRHHTVDAKWISGEGLVSHKFIFTDTNTYVMEEFGMTIQK